MEQEAAVCACVFLTWPTGMRENEFYSQLNCLTNSSPKGLIYPPAERLNQGCKIKEEEKEEGGGGGEKNPKVGARCLLRAHTHTDQVEA